MRASARATTSLAQPRRNPSAIFRNAGSRQVQQVAAAGIAKRQMFQVSRQSDGHFRPSEGLDQVEQFCLRYHEDMMSESILHWRSGELLGEIPV